MATTSPLIKAFAAVILILALAPLARSTTVIPPKISDLRGNWLGQSDNGAFVRMTLSNDGGGALAINHYPNQPIWIYQVSVTKPKNRPLGYDLEFKLTPVGGSRPIKLADGIGFRDNIKFKVVGDPFGSSYSLTPELKALERINRLIKAPMRHP